MSMTALHWIAVTIAAIVIGVLTTQLVRERARRKHLTFTGKWPIPAVLPEEVDPAFAPGAFGPGVAAEVRFIGRGPYVVDGGTTDAEAWMLAVLARDASRLFEFGTCTGKTAYLWAVNTPADARITTVTLAPEDVSQYRREASDDAGDTEFATRESGYSNFLYSGTEVAHKIEQLFGDSKALDVAPWVGTCDLVFVDGSHAYSYVVSDSAKALALLKPGGLVLWHDYAGPDHSPGVYRALNELAMRIPLVRIQGTSFAAYRMPAG